MNKIKLVSDSTCDLSQELIKKYDIEIVPLYVNFKNQSFLDGVDLDVPKMYDMVKDTNELPKTAAPSPAAFEYIFKKYLELNYDIIYMGIGSKFSATLNSAKVAKDMLGSDRIYLIDSLNLSSGTGLLLLKAGQMINDGFSAEKVKSEIELIVPKVRSQFVIRTLDYLYKGGRLNALSAFVGTMFRFKPIIKVRDGVMGVGKKGRGKIDNAINLMVGDMLSEADQIDPDFMMITHSLADEEVAYIHNKIAGKVNINQIYETQAGCVISSHCGKGTIGVLYILK